MKDASFLGTSLKNSKFDGLTLTDIIFRGFFLSNLFFFHYNICAQYFSSFIIFVVLFIILHNFLVFCAQPVHDFCTKFVHNLFCGILVPKIFHETILSFYSSQTFWFVSPFVNSCTKQVSCAQSFWNIFLPFSRSRFNRIFICWFNFRNC